MEKYGVDTSQPGGEKTAAPADKCPKCGRGVETDSAVPKCPVHGTAPFEKGREG